MAGNENLTFEQLLDWVEGHLSPAEADVLATIVADPTAQAQLQWLQSFLQLPKAVVLAKPPASVRAELVEQFMETVHNKQRPGLFQKLMAVLSFDSAQQPAMAGLRAGDTSQTREVVFGTDPLDVALAIHPHPQDAYFNLFGQVLPNNDEIVPDIFAVQLLREGYEEMFTMADEMGEFEFTSVAPGDYWLMLSSDTLEITLPGFSLAR